MIQQVLAAGRRAAAQQMVDTCTITRAQADRGAFDESTGNYGAPVSSLIYEGVCRFPNRGSSTPLDLEAGEQEIGVARRPFDLPFTTESDSVRRGDVVTCLSSTNSGLVGQTFVVAGFADATNSTARRVLLEGVVPRG